MQNDVVAAATPVFHIDPPRIDPTERMAEVEQVILIATARMPKAQMRKLGRLSFAAARDDDDHSYFGQIRSEPVGALGIEFRYPMSARHTGNRNVVRLAAELVEGASCFARNSRELEKLAGLVRGVIDEATRSAAGGISSLRAVAIGVTPGRTADQLKVTVDVEMLGDDLTLGIERVCEHIVSDGIDQLDKRLVELAAKHVERRSLLAQAKVAGVSGWIEDSALRVLDISGLDRTAAIDLLRLNRQVALSFGGESGFDLAGGVYWDNGVVCGHVENRDRGSTFRLEANVLTIQANQLPATIIADLTGRHLGEVIEIDYIPGNALIVDVEESDGWLYLRLEIGRMSIEEALAQPR